MSIRYSSLILSGCFAGVGLGACADETAPQPQGIKISVAPLTLAGIGGACYDIEVSNGTSTVWSLGDPAVTKLGADQSLNNGPTDTLDPDEADTTTVCSGQFGNGAGGAITYVGPCDATVDSDGNLDNGIQNKVTLWVDGLYNGGGTADVGAWQDPCGTAGCALHIDCNPNADSLAEFNFSIMRSANQGFFDIAVNFEDIFCSAKFDTCYAGNPGETIRLLHGNDAVRDWTGVIGFTCTSGHSTELSPDRVTHLLMSQITITCDYDGDVVHSWTIDPNVDEGNAWLTLGDAGWNGDHDFHYAVYRGVNQLEASPGQSFNLLYWNVAFSLDDVLAASPGADCTLSLSATADDATPGDSHIDFVDGVPVGDGVTYPYITIDAQIANADGGICQWNALDGAGAVQTVYAGNIIGVPAPVVMCSRFDGTTAESTGGAGCPEDESDN